MVDLDGVSHAGERCQSYIQEGKQENDADSPFLSVGHLKLPDDEEGHADNEGIANNISDSEPEITCPNVTTISVSMLPIFPLNIDVCSADENVIKEEGNSPHRSEDDENIVEHSELVQDAKDSAVEEEDAQFDCTIGNLLDND